MPEDEHLPAPTDNTNSNNEPSGNCNDPVDSPAVVQQNGDTPQHSTEQNGDTSELQNGHDPALDSDRPSKRRKLTDSLTPQQRPSPRAVSPPWKVFSADGPTTFIEGGKRRSGRTNALPLDLQPSDKRRTRAAGNQTGGGSGNRNSSTPLKKADVRPASAANGKSSSKHARMASRTSHLSASASTSTSKPRRHTGSLRRDSSPSTPTRKMTQSNGKSHTSSQSRKGGRQSSRIADGVNGSAKKSGLSNGHVKSEDDDGMSLDSLTDSDMTPLGSDEDAEMDDFVPDPNAKLQKLKFNIRKPTLPTPSFNNTIRWARDVRLQFTKREFESMDEWLAWAVENGHQVFPGYDVYEGDEEYLKEVVDDNEERKQHRELARRTRGPVVSYTVEQAREEAELREAIDKGLQPGGKIHPDTCTQLAPEKFQLGRRQYGHWDHMINHARDFHRRMDKERRGHRENAKKLAYAAQARWLAIQPKSQQEIDEEREEAYRTKVTTTYKQCLSDLMAKFEAIGAELGKVRLARWEAEQEALGKKALNKVMEQSALLLDARRRLDSEMDSIAEESGDAEDDDISGSEGDLDSDEDSQDAEEEAENMSSSGSESDEVEALNATDDEKLTVAELKKKYGKDRVHNLDRPPDEVEDQDPMLLDDEDGAENETPKPIIDNDQNDAEPVHIDEATQKIYDEAAEESDESIDMSEEESSDEDDEEDEDESDGSAEDEDLGLFSLIASKSELKEAKDSASDLKQEDNEASEPHIKEDVQPTDKQIEPPTTNGDYPMDDEEELEEVSLIPDSSAMREPSLVPDAAQVQTPAASNDDVGQDISRVESHTERPSKLAIVTSSSPQQTAEPEPEDMELDGEIEREHLLPATPESSNGIKTPVPSLLRATLREYQHYGLDWLAGLYAKDTNGILADEMGLGKTIQTISLLAHIAEVHGIWGPHLVVVPTSVMLNWEVEFKKFLPGFKVLVYYGTPEERKNKRRGWLDDDKWNVVITSYHLVLSDQVSFKHRRWHYLVLDEAHNIKNWKSARWQTLLGFRTSHRLLLTGTPLQNNLTELWSLMFFLMPYSEDESGRPQFTGLEEFTSWFNKPVHQIMEQGRGELTDEARELVQRLHTILRPYLLRRLKADVEKQMPGKYEHVVYCKLSKRQRYLYDGFMSRASTRETLSSGNYLSIINCLMQLRKVCNHPDLFETRQIVTSFAMQKSAVADYEIKELLVRKRLLDEDESEQLSLKAVNLLPAANGSVRGMNSIKKQRLGALDRLKALIAQHHRDITTELGFDGSTVQTSLEYMRERAHQRAASFLDWQCALQKMRSDEQSLMNLESVDFITRKLSESKVKVQDITLTVPDGNVKVLSYIERKHALPLPPRPTKATQYSSWLDVSSPLLQELTPSLQSRAMEMRPLIQRYGCITPTVVAHGIDKLVIGRPGLQAADSMRPALMESLESQNDPFHEPQTRLSIAFPDKRLLQYDCGKLQRLDALLRTLQAGGHRALIFTQMTKVLDILEQFLNIHGHRYLRLDGSTKIEQRQILTDRFNSDKRILAFILSSRSGGLGINLTGADTVIFYDLDWNPAMDKQCQDRAHRIGQTRDVHIYRFVSEYTIEANILRKANQKRLLDDVIIQDGDFTTDHFNKPEPRDIEEEDAMHEADADANAAMDRILGAGPSGEISTKLLAHAEDKEDIAAAAVAEKEGHADDADFTEKSSGAPTRADTPRTPGPPGARLSTSTPNPQGPNTGPADGDEKAEFFTGSVQPRTDAGWHIFSEKPGIGVDQYILEHLEWELRDVPFVAPQEDRKKKKKGRKGEQYKRRR